MAQPCVQEGEIFWLFCSRVLNIGVLSRKNFKFLLSSLLWNLTLKHIPRLFSKTPELSAKYSPLLSRGDTWVPHFQALETSSLPPAPDTSCGHHTWPLIGWWSQHLASHWLMSSFSWVGSSPEPQSDNQVDKSGAWQISDQWEASILVTWSLSTNQRPVYHK